jgi:hypothetical protein
VGAADKLLSVDKSAWQTCKALSDVGLEDGASLWVLSQCPDSVGGLWRPLLLLVLRLLA